MATPSLTGIETVLRSEFLRMYSAQTTPTWARLVTPIDLTGEKRKKVTLPWLGAPMAFQEWTDRAHLSDPLDDSLEVSVKHYVGGIGFNIDDYEDDNLGAIDIHAQQLVDRADRKKWDLLVDYIKNGDANVTGFGLGHDGQQFFDGDHFGVTDAQHDNLLAGTAAAAPNQTVAEIKGDLYDAIETMMELEDDRGEVFDDADPMVQGAFIAVVPTRIYGKFLEAVAAISISNNTVRPLSGIVDVIPSGRLTADDQNDWYVFRVDRPIKPFVFVNRQEPRVRVTELTGELAVLENRAAAVVDERFALAYGAFHYAVKVVVAES